MRYDYQVIIAWNSDPALIKLVKDTFKKDIILEKKISLTKEERAKKINEIYDPIHVPPNSERCLYTEPLTLFLVQMEAKYRYYHRTEGYLLCNPQIMEFKYKNRQNFDYKVFHCSDSITEALKALNVLGLMNEKLRKKMHPCSIAKVEDLFVIRHLKDKTFRVAPLQDTVIAQRLQGYSIEELQDKYNFHGESEKDLIIRENTLYFFNSIPDFSQEHSSCEITVYKDKDRYIITDGMHRAGLLYFRGARHIFVKEGNIPCKETTLAERTIDPEPKSHLENLHSFIYELNNKNIKYVVIRGWRTMPKTADTDLDIVIHPDDYTKFQQVMKEFIAQQKCAFNVEVPYKSSYQAWYRAYRTLGIRNDHLTNKGYQFDTYNNVFFFGPNKTAITLSEEFLKYLFQNKKQHYYLNIPDELSEMILLYCRTYIDLNGNWKPKHKKRFLELAQNISQQAFITMLNSSLGPDAVHIVSQVENAFK